MWPGIETVPVAKATGARTTPAVQIVVFRDAVDGSDARRRAVRRASDEQVRSADGGRKREPKRDDFAGERRWLFRGHLAARDSATLLAAVADQPANVGAVEEGIAVE